MGTVAQTSNWGVDIGSSVFWRFVLGEIHSFNSKYF